MILILKFETLNLGLRKEEKYDELEPFKKTDGYFIRPGLVNGAALAG